MKVVVAPDSFKGSLTASEAADGKTISGVLRHANALGIPVIALAGSLGFDAETLGLAGVDTLTDIVTEAEAIRNAEPLLRQLAALVLTPHQPRNR